MSKHSRSRLVRLVARLLGVPVDVHQSYFRSPMREGDLLARDAQRDIGAELLDAVRRVKADRK